MRIKKMTTPKDPRARKRRFEKKKSERSMTS
jgi:hypothetical protein